MVSIAHQHEEFDSYSETLHGVYPSPQLDHGLKMEQQDIYGTYPPRESYRPSTMPYDNRTLYLTDAPAPYMYSTGPSSPSPYPEEADMRHLTPSASSSNTGSPLSHHGQMTALPGAEWGARHGASPGIVDHNDFYHGAGNYSYEVPGMDGYPTQFDYVQAPAKGPGFVGEFANISRSTSVRSSGSSSSPSSFCSVSPARPRLEDDPQDGAGSVADFCNNTSRTRPQSGTGAGLSLALDIQLAQQASLSPSASATTPLANSSLAFASPCDLSISSFSSPPPPVWNSARHNAQSPIAQRNQSGRLISPFFFQSSGHFIAPLGISSCWFPLAVFRCFQPICAS